MLRLTREVRFTIPQPTGEVHAALNGLSGNLSEGPGVYLELQVCLRGELSSSSNYIENIKTIDGRVRREAVPAIASLMREGAYTPARAAIAAARVLSTGWDSAWLDAVQLRVNPYLSCQVSSEEPHMVYLTQRFEFAAAHRLHNPNLDEIANYEIFGKCNNPAGHGHNYEFEVTLAGTPDNTGRIIDINQFTHTVNQVVLERFDHKHLNTQTEEFEQTIPTVENIAAVIFRLLEPSFPGHTKLHAVRVWETGKTFAEWVR